MSIIIPTQNNLQFLIKDFTDTRQSRFESMHDPPISNPIFKNIWAPVEGFVANRGFKLDF